MNYFLFVEALITLLVMINPLSVIPSYLSLTKDMLQTEKKTILKQAMIFALAILLTCIFVGRAILAGLGISTFALQIAGGLLFFKFGYEVMTGELKAHSNDKPGLVPLGFPIIAGPGSITAIILFTSQHEGSILALIVATTIILFLTFVLLYHAKKIVTLLGDDASTAIVKLMGLLVLTIGIQLILAGIQAWLVSTELFF